MNLHDYFASPGSLSASDLAELISVKSVAQIRQWQHGYANRLPSPENCLAIEVATKHAVTRQELRPNDFWKIWPDLAHLAPTPDLAAINLDVTDQERRDHERRDAERRERESPAAALQSSTRTQ